MSSALDSDPVETPKLSSTQRKKQMEGSKTETPSDFIKRFNCNEKSQSEITQVNFNQTKSASKNQDHLTEIMKEASFATFNMRHCNIDMAQIKNREKQELAEVIAERRKQLHKIKKETAKI
jgi:hypothetical protein